MSEIAIRSLKEARLRMIEGYNRDLADIDAAIAQLQAANGNGTNEAWKTEIPVRPGQYKGMDLRPALEAYLLERAGGPVDIRQAVKDLDLAGADLGKTKERYVRNVRITVSNSKALRYGDRGKNTVELADRMR
jgi:hypothetical protein